MIRQFNNLVGKKVLVYGTGVVASEITSIINGKCCIVGILDKEKTFGEFCGYQILSWDELLPDNNTYVVVASAKDNCLTILERIRSRCIERGYRIISAWGEDITYKNGSDIYRRRFRQYCAKEKNDLIKKIEKYESISFDIFDTLIMRKVVNPEDIFEIVELKENVKGFAHARREAGNKCIQGNIFDIYKLVREELNLSEEEMNTLIQKELYWEKNAISGRKDVLEAYNLAIKNGKNVCLISDMYLPEELLVELLDEVGIKGYKKIYVSCDIGARKEENLYEIYKTENAYNSYLHIGDNYTSDVKAANEHGIDSFYLMNAWDMYTYTPLVLAGTQMRGFNDRMVMGMIIEVIFNSPFSFYQANGSIMIDTFEKLAALFLMPVACSYILSLLSYLTEQRIDGKVLLAARDCWWFADLFTRIRKSGVELPESCYFYTSRKAAFSLKNDNDAAYNILLSKCGIDTHRKNVFCEFFSKGTTQFYLDRLFDEGLKGFYFCTYSYEKTFPIDISSVFHSMVDNKNIEPFCRYEYLLELLMSSVEPSVLEISSDGLPIFDEDQRTEDEKKAVTSLQKCASELFMDLFQRLNIDMAISEELVIFLIRGFEDVVFEGNCKEILNWKYYDNFKKKYVKVDI